MEGSCRHPHRCLLIAKTRMRAPLLSSTNVTIPVLVMINSGRRPPLTHISEMASSSRSPKTSMNLPTAFQRLLKPQLRMVGPTLPARRQLFPRTAEGPPGMRGLGGDIRHSL
jgi:hypothetical protein